MPKTAINPTRAENYNDWYQEVVKKGQLAETSLVRGCMTIKPWGFALWENMQNVLDKEFKRTGHKNAYFPLLIPLKLMSKEADHVDGFATECAVVTHHRLEKNPNGSGLVPAGKLEEPYIIRPTSEMVIGEAYSRWINSWRDLPLKLNQWCNVMRWEMRTRLFLRTSEFLWQEGHTAHATAAEAEAETAQMLEIYADFLENTMAMPVIRGRKSDSERFPGAVDTLTVECMMQDGKALQAGTSHYMGQNFAKALGIQFQNKAGNQEHAYTTSWGVSTRMVGGMVMTHADDDGLVIPPKVVPSHAVILPFLKGNENDEAVLDYCYSLKKQLEQGEYAGRQIEVEVDAHTGLTASEKKWNWVRQGVPLRIEVGAREMEAGVVSISRRDVTADGKPFEKEQVETATLATTMAERLEAIHQNLLANAQAHLKAETKEIADKEAFYAYFKGEQTGFALTPWDGDEATEKQVKTDLGVTTRCLPLEGQQAAAGKPCAISGKPAKHMVVWAKTY